MKKSPFLNKNKKFYEDNKMGFKHFSATSSTTNLNAIPIEFTDFKKR